MRVLGVLRYWRLLSTALLMLGLVPKPAAAAAQDLEEVSREGEKAILTQPGLEITGAAHPDVTIVEYFDYNCPFCKRVVPTFRQLLADDRKLAIVYKDWPVLGEASVYAARCALAAGWQEKYLVAHDALLSGPRLSQNAQIESILQSAGIDVARLKKDLTAHSHEISAVLARNDAEAHSLELEGTPGIMVGRQLMPGGADLGFFQKLIVQVRSEPK